tara:strand:- start:327 stop:905 length:579 start_codon:yes stop_codon:yes gene_type:complete
MQKNKALTKTLNALEDSKEDGKIRFGDVIDALEHRGFGPFLIGFSLIMILPTGAVPLVPGICAAFVILFSAQILIGRSTPWTPQKLRDISFEYENYQSVIEKARPTTEFIDRFFHGRMEFLTGKAAKYLIATLSILLSVLIIVLGAVPFFAALPASAILFFGLAMTVKDGLMTLIGLTIITILLFVFPQIIG